MVEAHIDRSASYLRARVSSAPAGGGTSSRDYAFGPDFTMGRQGSADVSVDAPLVFAGYGISAPEYRVRRLRGRERRRQSGDGVEPRAAGERSAKPLHGRIQHRPRLQLLEARSDPAARGGGDPDGAGGHGASAAAEGERADQRADPDRPSRPHADQPVHGSAAVQHQQARGRRAARVHRQDHRSARGRNQRERRAASRCRCPASPSKRAARSRIGASSRRETWSA